MPTPTDGTPRQVPQTSAPPQAPTSTLTPIAAAVVRTSGPTATGVPESASVQPTPSPTPAAQSRPATSVPAPSRTPSPIPNLLSPTPTPSLVRIDEVPSQTPTSSTPTPSTTPAETATSTTVPTASAPTAVPTETAAPTEVPTAAPTALQASPTPAPTTSPTRADIRISCIRFDGEVPRSESDEYVEIANLGNGAQQLVGWVLQDVTTGHPSFTFPDWDLEPGEAVRVYTNEIHPESGGFSFDRGSAVWSNSGAGTAELRKESGVPVSSFTYNPDSPPGCE